MTGPDGAAEPAAVSNRGPLSASRLGGAATSLLPRSQAGSRPAEQWTGGPPRAEEGAAATAWSPLLLGPDPEP